MNAINRHQERRILNAGRTPAGSTDGSSDAGFDFGRLERDGRAFRTAAGRLAVLVASRDPRLEETHAIVSIARRATEMGEVVADTLGLPHIPTEQNEDGELSLPDGINKTIKNVVIVDDVFRSGEASSKVAALLSEAGISVNNVSVVIDQSDQSKPTIQQGMVTVPVNSLIHQPVPTRDESV